jgi:hypothetical protein
MAALGAVCISRNIDFLTVEERVNAFPVATENYK